MPRLRIKSMIEFNNTIVVIPARMASVRLPGKPLADIHGIPMIVHVWKRAVEANVGKVLVAAAENEIADVIRSHGGDALATDPALPLRLGPGGRRPDNSAIPREISLP